MRNLCLAASLTLAALHPAFAAQMVAVSESAMNITGDIQLDDVEIVFSNGESLVFDKLVADEFMVGAETVDASVYSVKNPENPVLLDGIPLCGQGPVTHVAAWIAENGSSTVVAVFSTGDVPKSDKEKCAGYVYDHIF